MDPIIRKQIQFALRVMHRMKFPQNRYLVVQIMLEPAKKVEHQNFQRKLKPSRYLLDALNSQEIQVMVVNPLQKLYEVTNQHNVKNTSHDNPNCIMGKANAESFFDPVLLEILAPTTKSTTPPTDRQSTKQVAICRFD